MVKMRASVLNVLADVLERLLTVAALEPESDRVCGVQMLDVLEFLAEASRTVAANELGQMPLVGVQDELLVLIEVARTLVAPKEAIVATFHGGRQC